MAMEARRLGNLGLFCGVMVVNVFRLIVDRFCEVEWACRILFLSCFQFVPTAGLLRVKTTRLFLSFELK